MKISLEQAAALIREGKLAAFPTETVYGLGANALDASAVAKIFAMKGRPATSPLIVHVSSIAMAREIVAEWPPEGVPIAAPSANRFMGLSPTTAEHVLEAFGDEVPVLDGGACPVGIESTVVSIADGKVTLLRPGMISLGDIEAGSPPAIEAGAHPSPGMHPRHYSPCTRLIVVHGPNHLPDRYGAYLWRKKPGLTARSVRMPMNLEAFAHRWYSVLHELDGEGWPWIAVEALPDKPEWAAIRDRVSRASCENL
jgi:L-threonylcarbamoyladenylate synthase